MQLNFETYNNRAKEWQQQIVTTSKAIARGMGVQHRSGSPSPSDSVNKIRGRVGFADGKVNRVSISFPRQLIYTQKGAGKGMGGHQGSRWINKYGNPVKTNPDSLGKMDTGTRKAKPFLNRALEQPTGVEALATIAAVEIGATITNNLFLK